MRWIAASGAGSREAAPLGSHRLDGSGSNQLNAAYDAKAIGDYSGLTPPFGFGH